MKESTDQTTLAIIDWLRQNDTEALVDRINCGVISKCECCRFSKYIGYGSTCFDAWKAIGDHIRYDGGRRMSEFIIECNYTYTDRNGKPCEEIVRCKDCKHCDTYYFCRLLSRFVAPDGFCAWGKSNIVATLGERQEQ